MSKRTPLPWRELGTISEGTRSWECLLDGYVLSAYRRLDTPRRWLWSVQVRPNGTLQTLWGQVRTLREAQATAEKVYRALARTRAQFGWRR